MLSNHSGSSFEDPGLYGERGLVNLLNIDEVRPEGQFDQPLVSARLRPRSRGIVKRGHRTEARRVFHPAVISR